MKAVRNTPDDPVLAAARLMISPAMEAVKAVITQVADADVTVLITGETGVGKELIARLLHALSSRAAQPFVKINCAAVPEELLESELFGHERGAFTGAHRQKMGQFELANGGTVFLDEIAELEPALQAKLLHVIQDAEFTRVGGGQPISLDVRLVCTTNRDLRAEVDAGRFREDLFYRVNVVAVHVPPLRQRREEIPGLIRFFAARDAERFGLPRADIPSDVVAVLARHHWPGNVRQLENVVRRMLVLGDVSGPLGELTPGDGGPPTAPSPPRVVEALLPLKEVARRAVERAEREVILDVLERCRWNRVQAARLLQISYSALLYKIRDLGLDEDAADPR